MSLKTLSTQARTCTLCAPHLPLGPRPIFRISESARILLISQAPGTKAHLSGTPFNDASGERLRFWLNTPPETFYDQSRIAIMPMGFCYPGRLRNGGDAPPRPECAPTWHEKFLAYLPSLCLTLLVGGYAQRRYLGAASMTTHVLSQHPKFIALPHPSWRTIGWEAKNPWFTAETLPRLRARISAALNSPPSAPTSPA